MSWQEGGLDYGRVCVINPDFGPEGVRFLFHFSTCPAGVIVDEDTGHRTQDTTRSMRMAKKLAKISLDLTLGVV